VSAGETVSAGSCSGLVLACVAPSAAPAPRLAEAARPRAQAGGCVGELAARQRPVEPAAAVRAAADRALGAPRPWPHSRHGLLAPAGWWRPKQLCRLAALLSLFLRPARHRPPEAGTHHGRVGCLSRPTLHQVAALQHVPIALHAGARRAAADALHQRVVRGMWAQGLARGGAQVRQARGWRFGSAAVRGFIADYGAPLMVRGSLAPPAALPRRICTPAASCG